MYQKPLDYILVYDFECNCSENRNELKFNEIIEFPCVIIDVKQMKVIAEFHQYVKMTEESEVTPFCTELTGITNEMSMGKDENNKFKNKNLNNVLKDFHRFLEQNDIFKSEFVLMSCGDFDGRTLAREANHKNFVLLNYFKRWINLKKVFPRQLPHPTKLRNDSFAKRHEDFNKVGVIKTVNPAVGGMEQML